MDEIREAQDYADSGHFFEQMADAVATRWEPKLLLKRVAASRALNPPLKESMQLAVAEGRPSPLSASDDAAVWAIFYANVRAVLQAKYCASGGEKPMLKKTIDFSKVNFKTANSGQKLTLNKMAKSETKLDGFKKSLTLK